MREVIFYRHGSSAPYALGVLLNEGDDQDAGFDYCGGKSVEEALRAALQEYGEPTKGLMAVQVVGRWYISDGVNPNTGKLYTDEEIAALREVLPDLHVQQ